MTPYLILKTKNKEDIKLELYETIQEENLFSEDTIVYSDFSYEAQLCFSEKILECELWINDTARAILFQEGTIQFIDSCFLGNKIFMDYFGYVQISVLLKTKTQEFFLKTQYVDVALKKDISSDIVRNMILYISKHFNKFLYREYTNSFDKADIAKSEFRGLATQLQILNQIIEKYSYYLNYFRHNSKGVTQYREKVDKIDKLNYIHRKTLIYIASHPKELKPIMSNTGIRINKSFYEPQNVIVKDSFFNADIYENRIILSFLNYLYDTIKEKIVSLKYSIDKNKNNKQVEEDYILSSFALKKSTLELLEKHIKELERINKKIRELFLVYQDVIKCKVISIKNIPKPTVVFLSVPHYRQIFHVIVKWFQYGDYKFDCESMLLSFISCHQIYEYYVLLCINNFLLSQNYELVKCYRHFYTFKKYVKYLNTAYENTFIFKKRENCTITIYYQPVIYRTKENNNKIDLFRNTSLSYKQEGQYLKKGSYYAPDFIIKKEENGIISYIIADAKWSTLHSIKTYMLKDLIYKYVFSVSTIKKEDILKGLIVLYGKEEKVPYPIYDSEYKERNEEIIPFVKLFSLCAKEESQVNGINSIAQIIEE